MIIQVICHVDLLSQAFQSSEQMISKTKKKLFFLNIERLKERKCKPHDSPLFYVLTHMSQKEYYISNESPSDSIEYSGAAIS